MDLMARYSLPPAERVTTVAGASLLRRAVAGDVLEIRVTHADKTTELASIPAVTAGIIADMLTKLSRTGDIALLSAEAEISPEDAAVILDIAGPLVRHRMDAEILPFRRVGTRRRLRLADVLDLKQLEAPIRAAQEKLRADTDDLMAHGL